jgi:transcriptional regulator with XRE-family HTH domain
MVSKATKYHDFLRSVRSGIGYWKSYSLLQFTLAVTRLMRSDKISGKKLAAELGISPAQVSKVLKGGENVTIETMVKFADALGAVVHIHVAKKGVAVQWHELAAGERQPHASKAAESMAVDAVALGEAPAMHFAMDSAQFADSSLLEVN